tara:strand:- start:2990 stop:3817 length:828 start_codon:yes stop_codon:yes gene_type:complete
MPTLENILLKIDEQDSTHIDKIIDFTDENKLEVEDLTKIVSSGDNTQLLLGTSIETDGQVIDTDSFVSSLYNSGLIGQQFTGDGGISEEQYAIYSSTLNNSIGLVLVLMEQSRKLSSGYTTTELVPVFAHTANDALNDPSFNATFDFGEQSEDTSLPTNYISYEPYGSEAYNNSEYLALRGKFGYEELTTSNVVLAPFNEAYARMTQDVDKLALDIASGILTSKDIIKTTNKLELTDNLLQEITQDEVSSTRASLESSSPNTSATTVSVPTGVSY